ncbi:glycosyltransferase [Eggerthellaceae bacterium zg-887]|uniref:glycosyltransferase family 2 protein n=1 Tax=Xiamenia xianingshaonis TaxID=2682776 RepID=UPI00140E08AF|nr:glycosyltransferase family 2 protein [Xiamenia xianingshaonis]NHM16161.1 glycosyltransferase [Xiamenia xianingshaonis]
MPEVSIIIPVYNTEDYLVQCIESVLSQTYSHFEVICVDDCSSDESLSILRRYAEKDKRVKVLASSEKSNAGRCRNRALDVATGEFLAFLDSDDYYEPTFLETMVDLCKSNNLDIALCRSYFLDDRTKKRSNHNKAALSRISPNKVYSATELWDVAFRYAVGWPWDKLFRRSFVEQYGLCFQEQDSTNDAYFVYSALAVVRRFAYTGNRLVNHRVCNLRSIENTRDKTWTNLFSAVREIQSFLCKNNLEQLSAQSFDNWVAEMCVWNIGSLKSSREEFYEYVRKNFAASFAAKQKDYFYSDDYLSRFAIWTALRYDQADSIFRLLDERRSLLVAEEGLKHDLNVKASELEKERSKGEKLKDRCEKLEQSRSYIVGRAVTSPARKLRSVWKQHNR